MAITGLQQQQQLSLSNNKLNPPTSANQDVAHFEYCQIPQISYLFCVDEAHFNFIKQLNSSKMIGLHCTSSGQTIQSNGQHCNQQLPTDGELDIDGINNNTDNNNNNGLGSLTNHIKLIQQGNIKSELGHNLSDTPTSQQMLQAAAFHHNQHHQNNIHHMSRQQTVSSPGYHSAAPSPNSSASSPVSSSCSSSTLSAASGGSSSSSPSSSSSVNSSSSASSSSSGASSMSPRTSSSSPNHLLDYYPAMNQDGISLTWFHEANTQARLKSALMSSKIIVSGDISLAEMSRYPVPIMAKPPVRASDLTLENWLAEATASQKAIKLTFTSTKTVEPAFRVLARYADQLRGPLILSADILSRPEYIKSQAKQTMQSQQQQASSSQPVDAWTFLMLCRTRFPRCTISIGWCTDSSNQLELIGSNCGPNWSAPSVERLSDNSSPRSSTGSLYELDYIEQVQLGASHAHLQQQLASLHPQLSQHQHNRHHTHQIHQNHINNNSHNHQHHLHHHHSLGSGASSSGNSSGSPSPTSPLGHLMHPHMAASLQKQLGKHLDGDQQAAAAAAMAAAVMAATSQFHQLGNHAHLNQSHSQQQQPLNLNINEAEVSLDRRLAAPVGIGTGSHLGRFDQLGRHVQKKAALSQPTNANLLLKTTASQMASRHQQQQQTNQSPETTGEEVGTSTGYTREMIDKMASLVKEYNLLQPVTFSVEARLIKSSSIGELQRLLYQVGSNSTLTVVAQQDDLISVDDLLTIRKAFSHNQILFDLPDRLAASLRLRLEGGAT